MAQLSKSEQTSIALAGALQIAAGILLFAGINEKNWNFVALCVLGFLGGVALRAWIFANAERRERETSHHQALMARLAGLESEIKRQRTSAPTEQIQPFDRV